MRRANWWPRTAPVGTKGKLALIALGAAAALAGYWYFNPQQRPSWVSDALPVAPSAEVRLYRWQNDQGQWQITDRPPPPGTEFEIVSYRDDTNVMPAPKTED